MTLPNPHGYPILIQIRTESGWADFDYCDAEKAGRFLGYGDNANWYRAIHAETGVECVTLQPEPKEERILRLDLTNWSREDVAILDILIARNS